MNTCNSTMLDCHCHILPGLDGGAVSVRAEALQAEGMYDRLGTDLHNRRYADFFDKYVFGK